MKLGRLPKQNNNCEDPCLPLGSKVRREEKGRTLGKGYAIRK
jgi:hypothetical protein